MARRIPIIRMLALFSTMIFAHCATDPATDTDDTSDTDSATHEYIAPDPDDVLPFDEMAEPPDELPVDEVPMFVAIGFDDNGYSGLEDSGYTGGMTWITDYLEGKTNSDGSPVHVSFYFSTSYIAAEDYESPASVKAAWRQALEDGHEVGNHTHSHPHGDALSIEEWQAEMTECVDWLTKPFNPDESMDNPDDDAGIGAEAADIRGFRTPFLEYNDATMSAIEEMGMAYDCSIEEGWHWDQNGTNYYWPYTLDNGSPGNEVLVEWGLKEEIGSHPGLWEMPAHPVIAPPDYRCEEYGLEEGFRYKLAGYADWFDQASGKITGFDYNMWETYRMNKDEFLATLKYTLDLRLKGNRAPMMVGAHTDNYASGVTTPGATYEERQEALEKFIEYALTIPEVRIIRINDIKEWMEAPTVLP